jgi:hypothetical protein
MGQSLLVVASLLLVSCGQGVDPNSPVIRRIMQDEPHNLSVASGKQLHIWFSQHEETAREVDRICRERDPRVSDIERRVCSVAEHLDKVLK